MRTNKLAVAAALAAAALAANAAEHRMESVTSPFTYEALGATPSLTFGRAKAAAPKAVEAPKATSTTNANVPGRTTGMASGTTPFTYDTLGATPHVDVRKPAKSETLTPAAVR